ALGTSEASALAQGGIAAAVGVSDTPAAHAADTIAAGDGLVDENMAHLLAAEAPARILDLLDYGVPFDKDIKGVLKLSREAAHSARRVVKVEGDMAGAVIMEALIRQVRKASHIRILEDVWAQELVLSGHRVTGVVIQPRTPGWDAPTQIIYGAAVVLATGGAGGLYALTTNPRGAIGSGMAMAARAGAMIADAEFVQFHPTAIVSDQDPAPLATEALRGEGAVLVNADGERFMSAVHKDAELAPRDIVARAVFAETAAGRGAFLDCRAAIGERFETEFPRVYGLCREAGIDPKTEPIPVAPAAHYHMGGVLTDANGRTSLDGLWACGEVAATGVHGANRLASNSLLEAVVFGARIAEDLKRLIPSSVIYTEQILPPPAPEKHENARKDIVRLREVMSRHVGVVRNAKGLRRALEEIGDIEARAQSPWLEAMCIAALLITAGAWMRRESRGGHFREDFPQTDPQARRGLLTLARAREIARSALAIPPEQEGQIQ
ncbi:MAG TPA: L-aspartate oxidase, partial [Rhizobiales bacterium]|nr:L-aspartate oxidase [Hyphomicrobiales bacterium]